jgi:hypothetical protein
VGVAGAAVAAPAAATSVKLAGERFDSPPVALPGRPYALPVARYEVERNRMYGFWYAVGVQAQPYRLVKPRTETIGPEALDRAIRSRNRPEVERLLSLGFSPDTPLGGADNEPALIVAAKHSSPEIVELLLAKGANVNAVDRDSETALIDAAKNGRADIVAILLKHGANRDLRDNQNETALDKARKRRDQKVAALLSAR